MAQKFESFADFYPYYLEEHSDARCRGLHYTGSLLILALVAYVLASAIWPLLWLVPLIDRRRRRLGGGRGVGLVDVGVRPGLAQRRGRCGRRSRAAA